MALQKWSVGWRAGLADLSSTTYLQDGSVNDTSTGVGDSESFAGLDCYDAADAAVTGVLDFESAISTYSRYWSCAIKATESNNAIGCVAPPDTATPENVLHVLVEASVDYNVWITLHSEQITPSGSPDIEYFSGDFGLATTARYLRVSAKNAYGKRYTTHSIGVDITDIRSDDPTTVTLAGAGTLTAGATATYVGVAALAGTGTVTSAATVTYTGAVEMAGTGELFSIGDVEVGCPCPWITDECAPVQTFEQNGGYGTANAFGVDDLLYLGGTLPIYTPLSVPISVEVSRTGYFVENWATLPYTYSAIQITGIVGAGFVLALATDDPLELGGMVPIYIPVYTTVQNSLGGACSVRTSPYTRRRCF